MALSRGDLVKYRHSKLVENSEREKEPCNQTTDSKFPSAPAFLGSVDPVRGGGEERYHCTFGIVLNSDSWIYSGKDGQVYVGSWHGDMSDK